MSLLACALMTLSSAYAGPHLMTPGLHMAADLGETAQALALPGWTALLESSEGFELIATTLEVEPLSHPLTEDAALRVRPGTEDKALFLFHGVPTDRTGPVPTMYAGARALVPGTFQIVGSTPAGLTVLVAADVDGRTDPDLVDLHGPAHLFLQHFQGINAGAPTPTLETLQDLGIVSGTAHLLWAGDLDGDGGIDLLIDETTSAGTTRARLLLSSEADATGLVAEAAVLETTGC